jgi:hypothetical protein
MERDCDICWRTHNPALMDLLRSWATRKEATPAQLSLAWLMAQKRWIVPIPGTTQMAHMVETIGADAVRFTPADINELNRSLAAIEVQEERLPVGVLALSGLLRNAERQVSREEYRYARTSRLRGSRNWNRDHLQAVDTREVTRIAGVDR